MLSNSLEWTGPCVMMRNLVLLGRASGLDAVDDVELDIVQYFIVSENDDIFRATLVFIVVHRSISHSFDD